MSKKYTEKQIEFILTNYENHTYSEIAKKFKSKFKKSITSNAVRKLYERYKYPVINIEDRKTKPKVLIFDIETSPLEYYGWGMWDQNPSLNMIIQDWTVLSVAAKWLGEDKIFYSDVSKEKNKRNDKKVLKMIWKLLDEADIVAGQNSNSFDIKKLNARFILNDMQPPSSYKKLDTKLIAKKHFSFTSNKLAYLTDKLCKENKKSGHAKYPGFSMWKECLKGNQDAFKEMKDYNIKDITSTEELLLKLLPWENANLFHLYNDAEVPTCTCGSTDFKKAGFYYTNASKFQKYRCRNCGSEYRDSKNLTPQHKKTMKGTKR